MPTFTRYACRHDYKVDTTRTSIATLPADVTSLRQALLAPNATLTFGEPRPDTSANTFCLSCHVDGQPPSLSIAALLPSATPMQNDPRRQPLQAPRRLFGWIPANLLGPGIPAQAAQYEDGLVLDRWLFPSAP